ncbi:hypothetical protein Micbo1qcDRAFT_210551 [Microdochium bolleyi]|uniref:Uncharacterized protein n=1 Tax=Microdochium bolleyi TaxID=196109 RepID=A0A136II02_9PEZI|nr:hypothetical protein Micbo1qcDRAFT_210551 [Microdochium bolleyi]
MIDITKYSRPRSHVMAFHILPLLAMAAGHAPAAATGHVVSTAAVKVGAGKAFAMKSGASAANTLTNATTATDVFSAAAGGAGAAATWEAACSNSSSSSANNEK